MLHTVHGSFIDLKQHKNKKVVTILVDDRSRKILSEGFPYRIADQNFNYYIKGISKEAKINRSVNRKFKK